jgi:hypothetical protein
MMEVQKAKLGSYFDPMPIFLKTALLDLEFYSMIDSGRLENLE